jgi:signal transduction histidine kinase
VLAQNALLARRAAVIDAGGRVLAAKGEFESAFLLAPIEDVTDLDSLAVGPNPMLPDVVAGFARFVRRGEPLTVRVDLSATEIMAQQRAVRTLTWVALPVNGLIMIFVLLYLARSLRPYEQLLSQARSIDTSKADPNEDEIDYLLTTFESAMQALARERDKDPEDEIDSLQRALAPSLESGVLLLDEEGTVLALNPFGASILGVTEVPKDEPVAQVLSDQPELVSRLIHALDSREGIKREEVTIEVGLSQRILGLTVHPLRRSEGSTRGYLVLFVDLTEVQRQAEEERISHTLEQLAELAAGIAHELRNSLATLLGYLTLIERQPRGETGATVTSYLAEIRHESERMERVLKDFLTFATPGSLRSERVALNDLIRRAASDPILASCDLRVDLAQGENVVVEVDTHLVEQAIRNLLRNALEAQSESRLPVIEIELLRAAEGIEIAITDHGPGIPDAVRDHLFQPFVSGRQDGVGLGLSLTHRIASLHGGGLRLEDHPARGTQAIFTLPVDTIVTK